MFIMLGSKNQLGLLLLCQLSCYITSLTEFLNPISGLTIEFPRFMVLGDFNLPSLGMGSEVVQEFMVTMIAIGLFQAIQSPIQARDNIPDLVILLEQWLCDLNLGKFCCLPCTGQIMQSSLGVPRN